VADPINLDLNLLNYKDLLDTKSEEGKTYIMDPIRRKWIVMTPEEFVRQLTIQYLFEQAAASKRLISVEKQIKVNGITKRFDILLYDNKANPYLLVECKAPKVALTDLTFEQISFYNVALKVPYLLITNGRDSYFCAVDIVEGSYQFLEQFSLLEK